MEISLLQIPNKHSVVCIMSWSALLGEGKGLGIQRGEMWILFEKVQKFFNGLLVSR